MSPTHPRLILASSSPRRRELLASTGVAFEVRAPAVDETPREDEPPVAYVERIARAKAMAVDLAEGEVALAADTTVVAGDRLFGKPLDAADARRMLGALAGTIHEVHTAVAVRAGDRLCWDVATTVVTFASVGPEDLDWYVSTGEPLDKAGAYALQGGAGLFVRALDGSPTNVVGLPLALVADLLASAGHPLPTFRPIPSEEP
jgi:septum formation protein